MSIQSMAVRCGALGQVSKTFQQGEQSITLILLTQPTLPISIVGQQQITEGALQRGLALLPQQLYSCKECEMFPKEIPPPPGRQGRKPTDVWHISGSGSEHETEESEGADWPAVSKVCEQHGEVRILKAKQS